MLPLIFVDRIVSLAPVDGCIDCQSASVNASSVNASVNAFRSDLNNEVEGMWLDHDICVVQIHEQNTIKISSPCLNPT